MPKRNANRAYKRGEPHKDARLFIIVAEGEREDAYFNWFNQRNQRIRIHIVPRENQASAPNHFLRRLQKFLDDSGIQTADNDSVWFVLDTDAWKRAHIDDVQAAADAGPNWNTAISNPCFEVWLHYHLDTNPPEAQTCKDLKHILGAMFENGYSPDKACPLLETVADNARNADRYPAHYWPAPGQTKLYLLAKELLTLLGKNWNDL